MEDKKTIPTTIPPVNAIPDASGEVLRDKNGKDSNVKTFYFNQDELAYLRAREIVLNHSRIVAIDTEAIIKGYILSIVLPRLAVNPNEVELNINITTGTLEVSPKIVIAPQMPLAK